jgi:hypothetical protein
VPVLPRATVAIRTDPPGVCRWESDSQLAVEHVAVRQPNMTGGGDRDALSGGEGSAVSSERPLVPREIRRQVRRCGAFFPRNEAEAGATMSEGR